jgi:hypothetical protein
VRVKVQKDAGASTFSLRNVKDFNCALSRGIPDVTIPATSEKEL